MNLLGKSLTVTILILSILFMGFSIAVNASHRNWRDVVMGPKGLKEQIETISQTNNQLRDSRARTQAALDREQAARRTALAALQTQLTQLQDELVTAGATVEELRAANTELAQLDRSRAADLEAKTAEITRLRDLLRSEQEDRDKLFAQTLNLTDQMNQLRGNVQNLSQRNEQLRGQVTRYKEVVDAKGLNIDDPLDGAPPERNGNVLVVNRPNQQVELSIGADDGLRQGHMLDVTRGGRFVSRVKVRYTEPDRAVADILTDYSNGIIREGDRVDTTIE